MPGGEVMRTTYDQVYDVAIIGGGSAGLSAALILARARRSVVVIDGGTPRNAPASAAHGLLGQEGVNPLYLLEKGRAEAASYGARIMQARVLRASGTADDGFALTLGDGTKVSAAPELLAAGVWGERPALAGRARRRGS